MLKDLVLTNPSCEAIDFNSDPWKDAMLITPRHAVRTRWNEAAVEQHCRHTRHQLYISPAVETCKGKDGSRPLQTHEKHVAILSNAGERSRKGRNEKCGLPDKVYLAIGLKVIVTLNVQMDLDVANGARGTIVGIALDPNEPPFEANAPVVELSRLPSYILVRMDRARTATLKDLDPGVLPILPVLRTYTIPLSIVGPNSEVTKGKRTVSRLQFPVTPAYAFTDYRSQGQIIPAVIVDIASPPTGNGLTLASLYVALSRSSGHAAIRLLRDFDENIFARPLDYDLMKEDERQEKLDKETTKC
ncbi:hypothetical protein FRC11_003516 [Ceratobasidium sp. 423]|nr:hypothetical protein FRC11_003516 [Ceratobasidium sp. 423]